MSMESGERIIRNFVDIIRRMIKDQGADGIFPEGKILGIGMAFPGPFDYENGISFIKGLDKFEGIFGLKLREELKKAIAREPDIINLFASDYDIKFANDAEMFALGEYARGWARDSERTICVCIGTGAGSAFLEKGHLVKDGQDVPENGWIYPLPFRDGRVDDYLSSRGLLKLCGKYPELTGVLEAGELYQLAEAGSPAALDVFHEFGNILCEIMLILFDRFKPDTMVIGGGIAKSHRYFDAILHAECSRREIKYFVEENTSRAILQGVLSLFKANRRK